MSKRQLAIIAILLSKPNGQAVSGLQGQTLLEAFVQIAMPVLYRLKQRQALENCEEIR